MALLRGTGVALGKVRRLCFCKSLLPASPCSNLCALINKVAWGVATIQALDRQHLCPVIGLPYNRSPKRAALDNEEALI
jgi:hypothetical protein